MKRSLLWAMMTMASGLAFAQSNPTRSENDTTIQRPKALEEVEITTTSQQNRSTLYQPASITKLSNTELKRGTGLFLDDAILANVPGVIMNRRAVSSGQQFNIRGYGNGLRGTNGINSNFDGQGYKVYLNGIPVTDAEGITVMDDIDFGSIGNVEVTKGPAGSLYGLAISGVVNLHTQRPAKSKTSVGQEALVGSYGLRRYTTHFATSSDKASLLVNYGRQTADGFMPHTNSTKRFINMAGDFTLNPRQSLNTYFGYSKSYDERAGELTLAQYATGDFSGNPEYIKRNAHSEVITFRAGVSHTYVFSSAISNTTTIFGTGQTSNASSAGGWTDKNPINYGIRSSFHTQVVFGQSRLSGITGVEAQTQKAQIIGYNMVANPSNASAYWIVGAPRSNQATTTANSSVFTEWTLSLPRQFSITGGLGAAFMKIELNDRFYVANSTKPTYFVRSYTNMISPHLAVNKVWGRSVSAYASYSVGHRAPVSSYFFIPFTGEVNRGLEPERGEQFEIGTKGSVLRDKLIYQLAFYSINFSKKMANVAVPSPTNPNATAYSYIVNSGSQRNRGLELLVRYTVLESEKGAFRLVRLFGNLTYTDAEYRNYKFQFANSPAPTDFSGKDVAGISPVVANLGLDLGFGHGFYGNTVFTYRDAQYITSDNLNKAGAVKLWNAKAGWRGGFGTHFELDAYAGVNNITSEKHYLMIFVNQLPDAYLPGPKNATYFGGLNLNYHF